MNLFCHFGFHKLRLVWSGEVYYNKGPEIRNFKGNWKVYRCTTCPHEESEQIKERVVKVSKDCSLI